MTNAERRAHLRAILERHNDTAIALREHRAAAATATRNLHTAYMAIEESLAHIVAVSDAILAANLSVLALLDADDGESR